MTKSRSDFFIAVKSNAFEPGAAIAQCSMPAVQADLSVSLVCSLTLTRSIAVRAAQARAIR
jgi:hypothetical protein